MQRRAALRWNLILNHRIDQLGSEAVLPHSRKQLRNQGIIVGYRIICPFFSAQLARIKPVELVQKTGQEG